ncbi:MAG: hypothetical protein ABSG28_00755 [Methanoregula sp.]|jgi:hypothetical protein|uniref:hypothetical protein n=1 Tax=Methanoregula sp. TaxID=2052170 RepID=UPI003C1BBDB6
MDNLKAEYERKSDRIYTDHNIIVTEEPISKINSERLMNGICGLTIALMIRNSQPSRPCSL